MKILHILLLSLIICPVLIAQQVVLQDDFEDGDWTDNPTWESINRNGIGMVNNGYNGSDWCVELYESGENEYGTLYSPFNPGMGTFEISFWIHKRTDQQTCNFRAKVSTGEYNSDNNGLIVYLDDGILGFIIDNYCAGSMGGIDLEADRWHEIKISRYSWGSEAGNCTWMLMYENGGVGVGGYVLLENLDDIYFSISSEGDNYEGGILLDDISISSDAYDLEVNVVSPNGGEDYKNDDTETITWSIGSAFEIIETALSYSTDDGNTWTVIDTVAGDVFEYDWIVPELYSVHCLVKVSCTDENDSTRTDESDAVFSIETTSYHHWFEPGWTMMSLPLNPYHASPQNVLGDDIDGIWDCYGFGYHTGNFRPEHMFTEQGYWLVIAHEGARVDVRGRANLETVVIKLDLPWNMIGSPFPVEVKLWDDVEFRLDNEIYSVYQACEAELIVPTMWGCNPDRDDYFETTTFRPWQGAWFLCLVQDLEMLISPPSPDPVPAPQRDENEASQDSWELTIAAELGEDSHDIAALGSHYEATDAFDLRFDFPKPPVMMESSSITAYFLHDDALENLPDRFNRDIRAIMDNEQAEWTLYVDAEVAGDVTFSWFEIFNSIPEGYEFTLIDTETRRNINMLAEDNYTYETEGGISEFTVRVTATPYGVEGDTSPQALSEFNLMSAYPNPFNVTTTIAYDLPYNSYIVVGVYDLSGRNITTLISDHQAAGSYSIVWNAEGLAAGIYLIKLSTSEHLVINKVALVK